MRGLAEIDFGRPRWREQPAQVMQMVHNYLRIDNPEMAPDVVFGRGRWRPRPPSIAWPQPPGVAVPLASSKPG